MTDRDRLIEITEKSFAEQYEKRGLLTAPHTVDYLLANGVIVPPCKVGDDIYYVKKNRIQEMLVKYWTYSQTGITMSAHCKDEFDMCDVVCDADKTCGIGFDYSHIGKTVFLTKEEAEAKLKELNKDA